MALVTSFRRDNVALPCGGMRRKTFALSETVRSEVASSLCRSDSPTCLGARVGDEGKAVGSVPTALLSLGQCRPTLPN